MSEEQVEVDEVENPFDRFPPEVRQRVQGLMHLGYLEDEVEFCGHTFGIRTLYADEELAAAEVSKPFRGSLREPQAFSNAQIGLALTHVDGEEEFCPQAGPSKVAFAKARFQYVTSNWFQPTLDFLFAEYARLLSEQVDLMRRLQDLSERSRDTSSPLPDSLTEPGTSVEEILGAIPDLDS